MQRIARYLALGLILYAAALLLMHGLVDVLGLREYAAYALVQALTFMVSLFVARTWVFDAAHRALGGLAARFLASTVLFRVLNWAIFTACFYTFAIERELGIIIAIGMVLPVKYWTEKELVFSR